MQLLTIDFTIGEARHFIRCAIRSNLNTFLYVILAKLKLSNEQKLELLENPYQRLEGPKDNLFHVWAITSRGIDTFFVLFNWASTLVSTKK